MPIHRADSNTQVGSQGSLGNIRVMFNLFE
jgi:hypothetical protein